MRSKLLVAALLVASALLGGATVARAGPPAPCVTTDPVAVLGQQILPSEQVCL